MMFTVPMCGPEVANSKIEMHLTNTAGEVGMRCYIYATSPHLNVRANLLR